MTETRTIPLQPADLRVRVFTHPGQAGVNVTLQAFAKAFLVRITWTDERYLTFDGDVQAWAVFDDALGGGLEGVVREMIDDMIDCE